MKTFRGLVAIFALAACVLATSVTHAQPVPVNFYAWGGQPAINDYLRWAARELEAEGITLQHVKVADIAEVVKQITSGRSNADLIWINGENFHALKHSDALLAVAEKVEGIEHVRTDIGWQIDFGESVDGLEVPWGIGQFHLLMCGTCVTQSSLSTQQLLNYAKANPGRISYPRPPEFHGTTFLKMLALDLVTDTGVFQKRTSAVDVESVMRPFWAYLEQLHPHLWQQGEAFPASAAEQLNLFTNAQLHNAVSFNPNEVLTLANQGRIPATSKAVMIGDAAITNSHYLAVPRSAENPEAAIKVIEFLLSETAQRKKADLQGWGDPAVIQQVEQANLLPAANDFHVTWHNYLEKQWAARFH
ncbi:ABC transporter substrate-binding protein [Pseudidiomarina sp.]|uniref:ABC transporter substrate-binding protein n=1 Tax=Pseudidiomarina sp. TaxID=2081707 RepID=UPI003A97426A